MRKPARPSPRPRWRPLALAAVLSLGLHGAGLLWTRHFAPRRVAAPAPAAAALEVEVLSTPPPSGEPARFGPATSGPERPPRPARTAAGAVGSRRRELARRGDSDVEASLQEPSREPPPEQAAAPLDPDRRRALFPTVPGVGGTRAASPDTGRGVTLRNDGLGPDPRALAEKGAEDARRRVDGWMKQDLGTAKVANGAVDPYFSRLRSSLEEKGKEVPRFTLDNPFAPDAAKLVPKEVKDLMDAWLSANESYGRVGNPYAPGAVAELDNPMSEASPLRRLAQAQPGSPAAQFQQQLDTGASLRDWASGKMGQGLLALVEVRQGADGHLVSSLMVKPSGNPIFDRHVMKTVPSAVGALEVPDGGVWGVGDGWTSLWQFEGRVKFLRKARPDEKTLKGLAKTAALNTLLGMIPGIGALPQGGGFFDETTGETWVIDLSEPQFTCSVKLLGLY